MVYTLLEDSIEIDSISLRKYNQNIYTLHALCISLNNALDTSKNFVTQVESFMASSFTLASDLHKIGLQFQDIGALSVSISQLNKEINTLLPQSLRDCKLLLDYSVENQVSFDHTESFKNLKQEVDKYLIDSNQYRRELRTLLAKYAKSQSDSTNEKITSTMAKLNQAVSQYEKYLNLLGSELNEFCGNRHKYLLNLSKNILNLHHLVHFGKKLPDDSPVLNPILPKQTAPIYSLSPLTSPRSYSPNEPFTPPSNFKQIIDNPIYLKAFRIFAEKKHCLENLLFWLDAHTLRELEENLYPIEKLRHLFLNMYNNYLAPDCAFEVNIDSDSKHIVQQRRINLDFNEPFYPALSSAVEAIYQILNFSMFPIFIKSPLFHFAAMMNKTMADPSEYKGVSNSIESIDSILRNPISIEYFLLFLKQQYTKKKDTGSGSASPNSPGSPNSLSPSVSFNNFSLFTVQLPPVALALSPRLSPLVSPFCPNSITHNELVSMVSFYLEINKFRESAEEHLEAYSIELYDTYLKPGCEKQITSISYAAVHEKIASKSISKDMFQGVSQDILLHIANTYFSEFLNSQLCKDMLIREEKMKKYTEKEEKKKPDTKVDLQFEMISREKLKLILPKSFQSAVSKPFASSSNSSASTASNLPATIPVRSNSIIVNNTGVGGNTINSTNISPSSSPTNAYISSAISTPAGGNTPPLPHRTLSTSSNSSTSSTISTNIVPPPSPISSSSSNNINNKDDKDAFMYILNDSIWLDSFKRFVKSEKSEELLLCYLELDSFVKGKKSAKIANNIYETFFKDGSPLEVNMEYEVRNFIKNALPKSEEHLDNAMVSAHQSILEMIRVDPYSRFLKSSYFKDTVLQLGDPFDPKNKRDRKKK
ncbi:hypothetical protein CYY_003422 [Polysphondylium violaceum]|uniref:RGS domain-containing protein n=1 Tax=Polysphondylium violaceum TaxID=133409 RepID=A0A8J4PWG5_9MYCE|nr:hypothetical protein CYY_003422 [Polysphondylium violaceum]